MATRKDQKQPAGGSAATNAGASLDELMLAALERGGEKMETGRFLVTYKEGAGAAGSKALKAQGLQVADARDFQNQALTLERVGDADATFFPEIGVALIGGGAARAHGLSAQVEAAADSPIESVDPEYFVFSQGVNPSEYLRGFLRAAETINKDLGEEGQIEADDGEEVQVLGATWGLNACRVPPSLRSGVGIKVAVLDTGLDLGHPDFAGRPIVGQTFVGQPVQDLHSHGTHCIGTACGTRAPAGTTPRYGIAYRSSIFVGKVLQNNGWSVGASVLNGMNWAIANRCQVISMSLGSASPVHPPYTAAGQAALNNGLLIIAAAGNHGPGFTGAPANSPTIMSVASLDSNLTPSSFSARGKIEIAGPGRDVYSSVPRPVRYGVKSGTSMAAPHVAGCAALWAETSPSLRGLNLWRKLQATARRLPFPAAQVGAGLVQAP
jgi:subtilisin